MTDSVFLEPYQSIRAGGNWYRNIQFLGKGGNGTTFLVTCTGGKYKGEIFALKIFHKISSEERKIRFLKEIEFMKEQHHPSVMRQYDEGIFADRPFVIVEYLPNTLAAEINKGSVSVGKGIVYSLQLLSAVKHLQDIQIIHRDIKPENIFINNYSAILGDFGLIKKNDIEDVENIEDIQGYVAMPRFYRTPELIKYAKGEDVLRIETDVFQLGLVLAHMFTGWNPLLSSENILDEIKINDIKAPLGVYGKQIREILIKMLDLNWKSRIKIDAALDSFNGIFENFSKRKISIDGQLFD
jgi:serine/threonine-protein kinase